MCGNEKALVKASIEGAVLEVCERCARFGKVLARPQQREIREPAAQQRQAIARPQRKEVIELITADYAKKIKEARERLGLTQEEFSKKLNEKWSAMQKMESGQMKPSIEQARKLEKLLRIQLVEQYGEEGDIPLGDTRKKEESFTLGDFIKTKKKTS